MASSRSPHNEGDSRSCCSAIVTFNHRVHPVMYHVDQGNGCHINQMGVAYGVALFDWIGLLSVRPRNCCKSRVEGGADDGRKV